MKKLYLVFFVAMLLLPVANAMCDNISATLSEPEAQNYTYSIQVPLTYTSTNATTCWFELVSDRYSDNISLPDCSGDYNFDVDYDDTYLLKFWNENTSRDDKCNVNVTFTIDRTSDFEEGKPTMIAILIGGLIIIAFYLLYFASKLDDKFKLMVHAVSFLFIYAALALTLLIAREYIKVPAIQSNLETIFTAVAYGGVLIASIMFIIFIVNVIDKSLTDKQNARFNV